jgi:hypothetical protein
MKLNTQVASRLTFSSKPSAKTCKICGGLLYKEKKNVNGEVKDMLVCSICYRAFPLPEKKAPEEESEE